ncbi:MAG: hypothetical protein U9N54_03480 [candidate division Zixibacteria bacterium]|nr:hypothetical protein [candidate division Zixibacteria bacterium]
MADVIRKPIKYIAELFKPVEYDPRLAIADSVFGRENNVYMFSIAELITDPTNYWIVWGGWFDNPTEVGFQIYMDVFLIEVFTTDAIQNTVDSFYVDMINDKLYMNLAKKPWQYFKAFASIYTNTGSTLGTSPKDETNPSDIYYGNVKVDPVMEVPSLKNSLNDVISGINVYNSFSIIVDNADGKYDGFDVLNYFNTPLQISKTSENATSIEDFERVRFGHISNIKVDFGVMEIEANDKFYTMNRSYCNKFTLSQYPNMKESNEDKDIPVGWGSLIGVELFQVNIDSEDPATWVEYIAIDSNYITACTGLYDKDGNSLSFNFNSETGIIRATSLDDDGKVIEAKTANITGYEENSIGQIIIKALTDNENLPYVDGVWDITETDLYLDYCFEVGFYFKGGSTKDLINNVLKSDIAFLIQKNNGLLTIRQWGKEYEVHTLPSWIVTQNPVKDFEDANKYYCSSARINYKKNQKEKKYEITYLDDSREKEIFEEHRKSFIADFETDLLTGVDAQDLAIRTLRRFGEVRETLTIGAGINTYDINLLDTVRYEALVNDRDFSDFSTWIVKSCDPGQDVLIMEGCEITYVMTFDEVDATLDNDLFETDLGISGDCGSAVKGSFEINYIMTFDDDYATLDGDLFETDLGID